MAIKTGFFIFRIYLYFLFPSYLTKRVISLKAMKTFFNNVFHVMKSDLMSGYLDTRVDTSR